MSFFKKLSGGAQNVLKKSTGGIDTVLRKTINTAGKVGGYIDQATPYLNMIDPELGAGASQFSQGLQQGSGVLKQVRGVNSAVRSGDINSAIQKAKDIQPSSSNQMSYY